MKTRVYVDGFNLYNGVLKNTHYRWLDLGKFCRFLLPRCNIDRICYFTALVRPTLADPRNKQRQMVYIRALETLPNISIHYGHFLSHSVLRPLTEPPASARLPITVPVVVETCDGPMSMHMELDTINVISPRVYVPVEKTEEKGSDVNLATHLLWDAFQGAYETAVIVSNDSDLAEPIRIVKQELGKSVVIVNPHRECPSKKLRDYADRVMPISERTLRDCQFLETIADGERTITRPPEWL